MAPFLFMSLLSRQKELFSCVGEDLVSSRQRMLVLRLYALAGGDKLRPYDRWALSPLNNHLFLLELFH